VPAERGSHTLPVRVTAATVVFAVSLLISLFLSGCAEMDTALEEQLSAQDSLTETTQPIATVTPTPRPAAPQTPAPRPAAPVTPTPPQARPAIDAQSALVTQVIDGDTIEVRMPDASTVRVRLIGVDTPESRNRIEPFGKEASNFTNRRLDGRTVFLETDVRERDRYGRLLAYVWLEMPASVSKAEIRAKQFNAILLIEGYANLMTIPPNVNYVDYFVGFQREAREANTGLWRVPAPPPARTVGESEQPAGRYVGSARSDVFHYPDCRWAQRISPANSINWNTRDAAVAAGKRPCKTCDP